MFWYKNREHIFNNNSESYITKPSFLSIRLPVCPTACSLSLFTESLEGDGGLQWNFVHKFYYAYELLCARFQDFIQPSFWVNGGIKVNERGLNWMVFIEWIWSPSVHIEGIKFSLVGIQGVNSLFVYIQWIKTSLVCIQWLH